MAFDFKKVYKEFYRPKNKPEIVTVPKANYIAVRGKGNPNEEGGAYQQAMSVLYAVAYTLKMSYKTDYKIEGFFEYVVPPLEGFWWQDNVDGVDYSNKDTFNWISVIRLPDFITKNDFDWAVEMATKKKKLDCSSAEYLTIEEGLCVQIMHLGAFDDEPATVEIMDAYLEQNGYANDMNDKRLHHEIYLSDARKVVPEKWKTVIRHPIKKNKIIPVLWRCDMRLDGFGLFVEDMAKMIKFYRDVLGFEIKESEDTSNVYLVKDGTLFLLYGRKDFENMTHRRYEYIKGLNGHSEMALYVDTFEEVDAAYNNAIKNGATSVLEPELEPWGQRTCYISDPEGNLIEIGSWNKPYEEKDL